MIKREEIKKQIKEREKIEENKKLEIKKKNKIENDNFKKELSNFKKEQENINKKSSDEKKKIINVDINNIDDKKIKYKCLKELELLIRHGSQLSLENQNKLSIEINKLINDYDNESFNLIINIINSMLTIENNFNTTLIKNFIELLYKIPNIKEEILNKSLKILIKINKNIGIIDESENLFWNSLVI